METCPRCGEKRLNPTQVMNALSRTTRTKDSISVYVCTMCGQDEAFEDLERNGGATPQSEWPLERLVNQELVEMLQVQHDRFITEQMAANMPD